MPNRPMRSCNSPGCSNLVESGYCSEHKHQYNKNRGSSTDQGYNSRWRKYRLNFLSKHPLCVYCEQQDFIKSASVVDHIIPHKGNYDLFWDKYNHQGLCTTCHNRKTVLEDGGFGLNKRIETLYDPTLQPLTIPLIVLCGPSGSGKTTYAQKNMGTDDLLIDLDIIMAQISRQKMHNVNESYLNKAIAQRNAILKSLSNPNNYKNAWLISSSPLIHHRDFYRYRMKASKIIVFEVDEIECKRRLRLDMSRVERIEMYCDAVDKWWKVYKRSQLDEVIM